MLDATIAQSCLGHFTGVTPVYPCVSCSGEPSTGCSTSDAYTRDEQRGKITCLDLLAILFLMQLKMMLAAFPARAYCCLMVNMMCTRCPRPPNTASHVSISRTRIFSLISASKCKHFGGGTKPSYTENRWGADLSAVSKHN